MNDKIDTSNNNQSFLKRFYIYQKERFPFIKNGLLIAAFTFCAIAYSRICRGGLDFIDWPVFLFGIFNTITLFLLLRISDEFKDHEDDSKYRKYLPVIRGLISLKELAWIGLFVVVIQILAHLIFFPQMLPMYFVVLFYMALMFKEFFIHDWLRKNQIAYIISHMMIIPLVDIYASGLDWLLDGGRPHIGLLLFFAVSFMNGIVLEIGRKIKAPEKEEEGVISYSGLYGPKRAAIYWLILLFITLLCAIAASLFSGYVWYAIFLLGGLFLLSAFPAVRFLKHQNEKWSKMIEHASGIWAITMYLALGAIPLISNL